MRGLGALAEALGNWFGSGEFYGCAFINITAESAGEEWREPCCAHKDALRALIEGLIDKKVKSETRTMIALQALLVVEGMIVRFQMTRDPAVVDDGWGVLSLLESVLKKPVYAIILVRIGLSAAARAERTGEAKRAKRSRAAS
jgi:hypothetical protein